MHGGHVDREELRDRSSQRSLPLGLWIACLLMLLPVYVASIGPAHLLTNFQLNGHLNPALSSTRGQQICQTVYWPICLACERSDLCANSVSWYLGLCRKLSG